MYSGVMSMVMLMMKVVVVLGMAVLTTLWHQWYKNGAVIIAKVVQCEFYQDFIRFFFYKKSANFIKKKIKTNPFNHTKIFLYPSHITNNIPNILSQDMCWTFADEHEKPTLV